MTAGPGKEGTATHSLQPFQLVKFFSFSGLAVFLAAALALSWIISNYAKSYLLERSEEYALLMAENLSHQVFTQFVIPTLIRHGSISLRDQRQYELLDKVVDNTIHGLNIKGVTIYDSQQNIISYSTWPELRGQQDKGGEEYHQALNGESNSVMTSNGSLVRLVPGIGDISCTLRTYIPFRGARPEQIMGVIEITQDLSADLAAIMRFQGLLIISALLIMAVVFSVLWVLVARADRIIEERSRERQRLEEKLNQSERLAGLGKMVASVSHEIKNPLGIIRSTAEILKKRVEKVVPDNAKLADIVIEETTRLDGIVREFLDFARPQQPKLALVHANEIVDKGLAFIAPELDKNKIVVKRRLAQGLPMIQADYDLLYRALLNVLINAVQAMDHGGCLEVQSGSSGREVWLAVCDDGKGIPAAVQEQIFTPFFTDKNRGTGLGLAIVKNIIDAHLGTITVESGEGEGACFRISLPAGPG